MKERTAVGPPMRVDVRRARRARHRVGRQQRRVEPVAVHVVVVAVEPVVAAANVATVGVGALWREALAHRLAEAAVRPIRRDVVARQAVDDVARLVLAVDLVDAVAAEGALAGALPAEPAGDVDALVAVAPSLVGDHVALLVPRRDEAALRRTVRRRRWVGRPAGRRRQRRRRGRAAVGDVVDGRVHGAAVEDLLVAVVEARPEYAAPL